MKEISAFLEVTRERIRTFVAAGAPIRIVGTKNGIRYIANRKALHDWVCKPQKPAAQRKAG